MRKKSAILNFFFSRKAIYFNTKVCWKFTLVPVNTSSAPPAGWLSAVSWPQGRCLDVPPVLLLPSPVFECLSRRTEAAESQTSDSNVSPEQDLKLAMWKKTTVPAMEQRSTDFSHKTMEDKNFIVIIIAASVHLISACDLLSYNPECNSLTGSKHHSAI